MSRGADHSLAALPMPGLLTGSAGVGLALLSEVGYGTVPHFS